MFNYLGLRNFFISYNVLRLNSEAAIKRFSNLIIAVASFLKFSLVSAGQLRSHVQAAQQFVEKEWEDERRDLCRWALAVKSKSVFNPAVVNQERKRTNFWMMA